jgi:hypothetical protein
LPVKFSEIDIVRFKDGQISDWWHQDDVWQMAQRLHLASP